MDDVALLLAAVGAGFKGDADRAAEAFTDDATFEDNSDELHGRAAILQHFLAFGGRRELFELGMVLRQGGRAALEYTVRFRADAVAFSQRGMAFLELRDGLISRWRGVWVETETDLSAWPD